MLSNIGYKAAITFNIRDPLGGKINTVWDLVTKVLGVVVPLAGIMFVGMFIYAGITYITSSGDPGKVKSAQAMMSNSAIGFVIVVAAFVILSIVEKALGI